MVHIFLTRYASNFVIPRSKFLLRNAWYNISHRFKNVTSQFIAQLQVRGFDV